MCLISNCRGEREEHFDTKDFTLGQVVKEIWSVKVLGTCYSKSTKLKADMSLFLP